MPQINTKPQPAKPLIDATVPVENPTSPVKNITAEDLKRRKDDWNQKAAEREIAVARETAVSAEPTVVMRFELRKYARHWNAFVIEGLGKDRKVRQLLGAPSLLVSALDALDDAIREQAWKHERHTK